MWLRSEEEGKSNSNLIRTKCVISCDDAADCKKEKKKSSSFISAAGVSGNL